MQKVAAEKITPKSGKFLFCIQQQALMPPALVHSFFCHSTLWGEFCQDSGNLNWLASPLVRALIRRTWARIESQAKHNLVCKLKVEDPCSQIFYTGDPDMIYPTLPLWVVSVQSRIQQLNSSADPNPGPSFAITVQSEFLYFVLLFFFLIFHLFHLKKKVSKIYFK